MTDWLSLLSRHHAVAQADSGYEPIFGGSATIDRLDDVQDKIGIPLPAELKDLYRSVDGYGLKMDEDCLLSPWFIVPTSELPEFVHAQRSGIAGTHKSLSERFLPFIDLVNGDSIGYLYDVDGKLADGLHMFMHELYRYKADQEPDDFFRSFECSIAEFLEP
ncbi:SMI1/KNR4 family protein [Roseiconus nitratireducens]|uniref:SMI1/KNR4 family protein n=1 Tax=Roseiconus nitratireducens TaxID=2605748 RepID=A0A5M6CYR4_9BACT|nr:SMI1/KNR4 family protein [Roseiconus nitratireducens]KAA5539560.1 SMI1/KNR4 family protein [Roseiconus nitratireducens]